MNERIIIGNIHGPLARYVKSRVAHALGMPGTFSPPPRVSDLDMHHGTCGTHVPWCMPGSLTSGFLWSRWWEKRSQHSWRMHNPQFYLSGKRPMGANQRANSMWPESNPCVQSCSLPSYLMPPLHPSQALHDVSHWLSMGLPEISRVNFRDMHSARIYVDSSSF